MTSISVHQPTKQQATSKTETTTTTPTINNKRNEEINNNNNIVDKNNSFKLDKEREDFTNRLIEFHRHKNVNTPLASWPTLNGRAIDLHKLYTKVMSYGGWETVCERDKWNDVGIYLDKASFLACTNGAHALRLVYIRYLSMFEKFQQSLLNNNGTSSSIGNSLTPATTNATNNNMATLLTDPSLFHTALNAFSSAMLNTAGQQLTGLSSHFSTMNSSSINKSLILDMDKTDELSLIVKRKFSYLIDSTSMNYNYNQHYNHTLLVDSQQHATNNKLQFNPYEKLEISLVSGLPNEIDFVFNTILLLSSDEYHMFKIYTSTRLIDLMLAHVGFFGYDNTHRQLYDNVWQKNTQRNYVKFWHDSIQLPPLAENDLLLDEDEVEEEFGCPSLNKLISELMPKLYNKYLKTLPSQELLNLQEIPSAVDSARNPAESASKQQTELRRIEQVMIILNNLSFEENNADFMANKSSNLIEFLIMCIYCTGNSLVVDIKKHALDILVNLSRKLKLKSLNDKHKRLLLMSICHLIIGNCNNNNNNNVNNTVKEAIKEDFVEQGQDRLDITRGLEILTKLFAQQIDPHLDSIDYSNETILAQYYLNEMTGVLFLNKILIRLEQLLTVQDVFILMHTLECLYSMSQFNEHLCNLIVSNYSTFNSTPRIVSMLVNFLTVDTTHFGMSSSNQSSTNNDNYKKQIQNLKIYKISNGLIPANTINTNQSTSNNTNIPNGHNHHHHHHNHNQQPSIILNNSQQSVNKINSNNVVTNNSNINSNNSLLQQTLNNQHHLNTNGSNTVSVLLNNSNSHNKISTNLQQQQVNQIMNSSNNSSQNRSASSSNQFEQQAKNVLCNWLRTCFQTDPNSEISKTKLYPYYQQIAKINNWMVLTIPTFFEILNATFPSLRYNDATNQIHGIKLVVNVKQQLLLKKDELIQQTESEVSTWPTLPENNNNIKIKSSNSPIITSSTPIPTSVTTNTIKTNGHVTSTTTETTTTNGNLIPTNKLPTPLASINVITPSIMPLLTPPTPPPQPGTPQTDENLINNSNHHLINTNGTTINKQTSKLLNDTSNVNNDTQQQQQQSMNETKKYEKKIDCEAITKISTNNTNTTTTNNNEDPILNNIERRLAINNENNLKQTNGIMNNNNNDHVKLLNGTTTNNNKQHLTNGHADNHSVSSSTTSSTLSEEEEEEEEDDDEEEEQDEKMEEDGQIESFRKRTNNHIANENIKKEESSSLLIGNNETLKLSSPIKKQKTNEEENEQKQTKIISEENIVKTATNPTPPPVLIPPLSTPTPQTTITIQSGGDYICEWNNCKLSFNSAKSIYSHVCKYHLLNTETNHLNSNNNNIGGGSLCLWFGCDQIKRQKWSLVNHIQERHCNENALKNALMYRQRGLIPNTNLNNNNSNGAINIHYSKDAAFLAIQKNQRKSIEDFLSVEEGPISKSVRLLSALTLRNLARNSDKAKLIIKSHESVLTEIAFDLLESSNVLANCLWHLTN